MIEQRGRRAAWPAALANIFAIILAGAFAASALAQSTSTSPAADTGARAAPPALRARPCDGDTVTAIVVHASPPPFAGAYGVWHAMAHAVSLRHSNTDSNIVRAYLRLSVGKVCTDRARAESERLLRSLPFISSATVRAVDDGAGHTRIDVATVDEVPVIVGARLHHGHLAAVTLGNENLFGEGRAVQVSFQRGFAYRNGFGASVIQYGAFDQPFILSGAAERTPLGGDWAFEFAEPFLTNVQLRAFNTRIAETNTYYGLIRPNDVDLALQVRRTTYDLGAVTRLGSIGRHGTIGLVGAVLMGEDVRTGNEAVIVSDSGFVATPHDPELGGRYTSYHVTRIAAAGGIRAVHFIPVTGFDALAATQDIGTGFQFGALAGPSIIASHDASDIFASGDVYAGAGGQSSFVGLRLTSEGRADRTSHRWEGVVGSGRLAWYAKPSALLTSIASLEISAIQHLSFPLQLTFRDLDGGLPGYLDAQFAGGQRLVGRLEERRMLGFFGSRANFAVAAFADAGKLWRGDVPYGQTTGVHGALGVSLLGAYPAGGKRTYRVDFALPTSRAGGARWEVRFSATDRTQFFWRDPGDVARARTGAVPADLFTWPQG